MRLYLLAALAPPRAELRSCDEASGCQSPSQEEFANAAFCLTYWFSAPWSHSLALLVSLARSVSLIWPQDAFMEHFFLLPEHGTCTSSSAFLKAERPPDGLTYWAWGLVPSC